MRIYLLSNLMAITSTIWLFVIHGNLIFLINLCNEVRVATITVFLFCFPFLKLCLMHICNILTDYSKPWLRPGCVILEGWGNYLWGFVYMFACPNGGHVLPELCRVKHMGSLCRWLVQQGRPHAQSSSTLICPHYSSHSTQPSLISVCLHHPLSGPPSPT